MDRMFWKATKLWSAPLWEEIQTCQPEIEKLDSEEISRFFKTTKQRLQMEFLQNRLRSNSSCTLIQQIWREEKLLKEILIHTSVFHEMWMFIMCLAYLWKHEKVRSQHVWVTYIYILLPADVLALMLFEGKTVWKRCQATPFSKVETMPLMDVSSLETSDEMKTFGKYQTRTPAWEWSVQGKSVKPTRRNFINLTRSGYIFG